MNLLPVNAARRVKCPGSHKLESMVPNVRNAYKDEGDAAHWVASQRLKDEMFITPATAPNGAEITEEMCRGADLYLDYILEPYNRSDLYIEEDLDISIIHEKCKGRPDCWAYTPATSVFDNIAQIDIYEYKFGHAFVDAFENWQLIEYAAGVLDYLKNSEVLKASDTYVRVNLHIIQPRCFGVNWPTRVWQTDNHTLRKYFAILIDAEWESTATDAKTKVTEQCKGCSAKHLCTSLQNSSLDAVEVSTIATPHELTPGELSAELRVLMQAQDSLEHRIAGLSAQALALIEGGKRVPFFHAERSKGRQFWSKSFDEIKLLGELYGVDLVKPTLITPKQALQQGLTEAVINKNSSTPLGELKLKLADKVKTDNLFGND